MDDPLTPIPSVSRPAKDIVTELCEWPYFAVTPERYTVNAHRYATRGGMVDLQRDVKEFAADGRNADDIARFYAFCLIFDQIAHERLPGNCAELGVYRGDSAALIVRAAKALGKTTYLLDSFEGFDARDFRSVDGTTRVQFGDTSLEAVKGRLGDDSIHYVKGYFPTSSADLPCHERYCLVHLDCDLYEPMIGGLRYFYPRLVAGGYLLLHDYGSLHWPGVEKAADEFFADKVESLIILPDGAGTAIVRKAKKPQRRRLRHLLANVVRGRPVSGISGG